MDPASIDETLAALSGQQYFASRELATALFLALKMQRPLFLEGEPGVGKTELAKAAAGMLGTQMLRLQCYEGLDTASALYEWDYPRQIMALRVAEASGEQPSNDSLYRSEFLLKRPLLQALLPDPLNPGTRRVLLIDEIDRADEPFEAFLLELLSDFQVSIPEYGTVRAERPPLVVMTSNRTREVHDALKRRCLYQWIGYPARDVELQIVAARARGQRGLAGASGGVCASVEDARFVQGAGRGGDYRLVSSVGGAFCQRARSAIGAGHIGRTAEVPGRSRARGRRRDRAVPRRTCLNDHGND